MSTKQLRGWQREAFDLYLRELEEGRRSVLWEATPGAGKTTAALQVVRHQIATKRAARALIVVPTSHLKLQWARSAAREGLQLDSELEGVLTGDFHGAVVTYQQIGNREGFFRALSQHCVVVLDEIHHAGDGLTWGLSLRNALEPARFILCLTGTAFRSDNNPIPFVDYDQSGFSRPNFSYTYARAVEEQVCRPTAFFTYGGTISWSEEGFVMSADFTDQLEHSVSARRLRAAIEVDAGWIEPMVQDAHQMLLTTRKEHTDAGGLVVGVDHHHVRKLAQLLLKITGEKPVVVLSDDKEASGKIKLFSESKQPWIVACNMVSEGVDIPRLRVGVYATAVRTKMYFRQFLGRIVRKLPTLPGLQVAYLYLPADPLLRGYAEEIESETRHQLRALSEAVEVERTRQERAEARRLWEPLQAVNSGVEAVIVHGNQLSLFGSGTTVSPEQVLEVVKEEVHLNLQEKLTRSERKSELAAEIKRIVGIIHRKSGHSHSAIHTTLNRAQGVRSQTHCTEDQLRERIELLHAMTTVRGATLTVPRRAPRSVSE